MFCTGSWAGVKCSKSVVRFSVYCLILTAMVTGMIGTVVHLKKKQARINNQNGMLVVNYKGVERTALTSFLVTVSHFLLYVPTMLVIGLRYVFHADMQA